LEIVVPSPSHLKIAEHIVRMKDASTVANICAKSAGMFFAESWSQSMGADTRQRMQQGQQSIDFILISRTSNKVQG